MVQQSVVAHGFVHGHRQKGGWNEVGEQREVHHRAAAWHLQAADGKRRASRNKQRQNPHRNRNNERVTQLLPKVVQIKMLLSKDELEVAQGGIFRPQPAGCRLVSCRDRKQKHVVDRNHGPQKNRDADQQQLRLGCNGLQHGTAHLDNLFIMKYTKGSTSGMATTIDANDKSTWSSRK